MIERKNLLLIPNKILSMHLRNFLILLCMLSFPMLLIDHFIHSSFSTGYVFCLTLICSKILVDYKKIKNEVENEKTSNQRQEIISLSEIKEN